MSMKAWTRGQKHSLVRVTAPRKDAGNGTLMIDNAMWTYSPKVNRVMKVPSSMMGQSWMGSDFSNKDVSRADTIVDQYDHTLLEKEQSDGHTVYVIESVPHEDAAVVWGKEVLKVRDDNVLLAQDFYDQDGKLVKSLRSTKVGKMGGRDLALVQRMEKLESDGRVDRDRHRRHELRRRPLRQPLHPLQPAQPPGLMGLTLRLAWRNLWRHPRRTWLTTGAMIFSNVILVFMISMQVGMYQMMIDNSLRASVGHLQVQARGYNDEQKIRQTVPDVEQLAADLRDRAGPRHRRPPGLGLRPGLQRRPELRGPGRRRGAGGREAGLEPPRARRGGTLPRGLGHRGDRHRQRCWPAT